MILNPETISKLIVILTAWGAAFVVALWLALIFWTYRDIRQRTQDNMLRVLSILAVAVLFLPGIVIYLILRPPLTIDQEYQYTLEEEALLRSIESAHNCPGCGRRVENKWLVCPDCHTRLKKLCHQCGSPIELHWNLCPICGTPAPGMRKENVSLDEALRPTPKDS
jgi:hypothetical protein